MALSAVLFDLDGTVADTGDDLTAAANAMRAHFDLPPWSRERVLTCVGNGLRVMVEGVLADCPVPVDPDDAAPHLMAHYRDHLTDCTVLYDGVLPCLQALHAAGIPMGVVSNKPEAPARRICDELGVGALLGVVVGADTCAHRKPHPEPLVAALRHLGAPIQGSWMVGDNDTDLATARRAGLQRCFCRYGFGEARGESYEAAVDTPHGILAALGFEV